MKKSKTVWAVLAFLAALIGLSFFIEPYKFRKYADISEDFKEFRK